MWYYGPWHLHIYQERQDLKLQIFDENVLRQDRYETAVESETPMGWDMG